MVDNQCIIWNAIRGRVLKDSRLYSVGGVPSGQGGWLETSAVPL